MIKDLQEVDKEIYNVCINELKRGHEGLELIASENYVSKAVLQAMGSILTNKYSEGYPGKRYYGGNEFVDIAENLAIERANKLFGSKFANVQGHSGSTVNMEAYFALLELGDPILAMSLDHGGHLTHGHKVSFSGKFYNFTHYGVDKETHKIDMDNVRKLAIEKKPKLILVGASAYPRFFDYKYFREIADEVGAYLMADIAHVAGLIAAKVHPDAIPHCHVVTTTTHKTLRGPRGGMILSNEEEIATKIDKATFPGMQGGPLDHVIAAKAVSLKEALDPSFTEYGKQIIKNANALADSLMENGAKLSTDGTDNHLMLMDLESLNLGDVWGKKAESTLDEVNITTNKNMIPFDKRSPFNPSGIRLGVAALTTRGLNESDFKYIGDLIVRALKNAENKENKESIKQEVLDLCAKYPLYPNFEILR